jgi:MYXO-CTERM domain-containing protein
LEGRPRASHGGQLPEGSAFTDSWAQGSVRDRLLEDLQMFAPSERFADETRLLMIDRFVTDVYAPTPTEPNVPVTGFVTDTEMAEVVAHFTSVFGTPPFGSLEEANAQQPALLLELSDLQQRLLAGDQSAAPRLGEVVLELTALQNVLSAGARLSLDYLGCADHTFWLETEGGEPQSGALRRAVTVGTDAHLERTVIRYFNAEGAQATGGTAGEGGATSPGDAGSDATGTGGRAGSGGRNATGGIDGSAGEVGETGKPNDDSGCSCALPGRAPDGLAAWLLLALGYGAWQKRRSSKSDP